MSPTTESTTLHVLTDNVHLPRLGRSVPKGDYEGHIEWLYPNDGGGDPAMGPVQIVLDQRLLARLDASKEFSSMDCEVRRYLTSGDITLEDKNTTD